VQRSDDVKRRLQILMDLWLSIISRWESGQELSRKDVIEMLQRTYESAGIEPLRGASTPPDIYDKELASLYVVGKYGMGLEKQYPELFDNIFMKEIKYEEAIQILESEDGNTEKTRDIIKTILGTLDDNEIARMLRLKFTKVYFGFTTEDNLYKVIKNLYDRIPEKRKLASKYARFYIAFRVASAIARGDIKNKIIKEIFKQASALKLSQIHGIIPDDSYIATIARDVFRVPERTLRQILTLESGKRGTRHPQREGRS
jgi:hypothetical protein